MTEEDTEQKWLEVTSRLQLRSCSDAECAVMDFGEVGPVKRPEKISVTGSVGVLSPLPTDSADSCWMSLEGSMLEICVSKLRYNRCW